MYNSQNLPLSPKKIIKKTLPTIFPTLILFVFLGIIMLVFNKTMGSDLGNNVLTPFSKHLPLILIVLWILNSAWIIGYQYLYYKLYYYNFEQEEAEIRKGVIARSTGVVRYGKIQNLYVDQDFWDRILGLYDVHYETAGETSSFYSHVDGLDRENSNKLLEFLKERIGNPVIDKVDRNNIQENVSNNQIDDSAILFSRSNILLSKKYLFSSAIFNIGVSILPVGLIFGRFISEAEINGEVMPFSWTYLLLLMLLIFLVMMIYSWLWFNFFNFELKVKSAHIEKGIISRSSSYIYYNRIQNININQGLVDRLLGICYLNIETAGESGGLSRFQIPAL
ncbi:MAG: PH domain-containing protein, partial [bacterium]|nr:PH domain-containing protein [bacterium]